MGKIRLFVICFLFVLTASKVKAELSADVVFDILSRRFDNIMFETRLIRFDVEKSINRIEHQIENIANRIENIEEKSLKNDHGLVVKLNDHGARITQSSVKDEVRKQVVTVHKMMSTEKIMLREMVDNFENKFAKFESEIESSLSSMNASTEFCKEQMARKINENIQDTIKYSSERNFELLSQKIENESKGTKQKINDVSGEIISRTKLDIQKAEKAFDDRFFPIKSDIRRMSGRIDSVEKNQGRQVGFSACLTKTLQDFGKSQTIVFDHIVYNDGRGYSSSSGIFTAPETGTYLFMFNVGVGDGKGNRAHVGLKVNGTFVAEAFAEQFTNQGDVTGGNSAVVHVRQGEKVWIETAYLEETHQIGPWRTTFNGIVVY